MEDELFSHTWLCRDSEGIVRWTQKMSVCLDRDGETIAFDSWFEFQSH